MPHPFRAKFVLLVLALLVGNGAEVLQADWQEVWHSPQPPWAALFFRVAPLSVFTCFILVSLP